MVGAWAKAAALAALCALPGPALACRLALLLALDVSSSVDSREDRLQRAGLAAALLDARVQSAFLAVPGEPVALAAFEWSGKAQQHPVLAWTLIEGADDLLRAAEIIEASQRRQDAFPTALGYALGHAAGVFRSAPTCARQALDVSGDGVNNHGFKPVHAYRHFPLDGITVNALAIGGSVPTDYLLSYFEREVIRGPGAFAIEAADYDDFARAMKRKLLLELSDRVVSDAGGARR